MHLKISVGFLAGLALAGTAFGASCSPAVTPTAATPAPSVAPTLAPTTVPTPTVVPTVPPFTPTRSPTPTITTVPPAVLGAPISSAQLKLNLDAIFPPGKGRELVLDDCTTCHTFLRIVVGQRTQDQWEYVKRDMRGKVSQLSDQDVDTLFDYLEANFDATQPVPDLPDWFVQTGEW